MVIVKLAGGLGNQMFQYAAGRRLAEYRNTALKLDIRFLEDQSKQSDVTYRTYGLDVFNIMEEIADEDDIASFYNQSGSIVLKAARRLKKTIDPSVLVSEDKSGFNDNILEASENVYLDGHWQSEKYFRDYEDLIRKDFAFKDIPAEYNSELIAVLTKLNSVSIHVRRGDYVSNKVTNEYHGICDPGYYKEAVQVISDRVENPHFFVFSDDQDWVQKNIKLDFPTRYVNQNQGEKSYEDMRLMSCCKHHIVANSSFSWWGAWLSDDSGKIVVAPRNWLNPESRWFKKKNIDMSHVVPEAWIRV